MLSCLDCNKQISIRRLINNTMEYSAPAVPRRHAQRKTLRERWARSPSPNFPSPKHRPAHKLQARRKRKRKSAIASDDSSSSSGSDADSDSGHTRDSGYNSDSSDAVAEYLKQRRAQHESAGPTLSDPCDSTRNLMRAERKQWKR